MQLTFGTLSPAPYRLLHDDPAGGCDTREFTGDGDWYPNYCKTECLSPAIGFSSAFAVTPGNCANAQLVPPLDPGPGPGPDPGSPVPYHFEEFTHLMACNGNGSPGIVQGTGYTLSFPTGVDQRSPSVGYNWAPGLRMGECDNFSAIVGVASEHYWHGGVGTCGNHGGFVNNRAYGIAGARCSTLAAPEGMLALASDCQVLDFTSDSVNEAGGGTSWVGEDWDFGYHKGQCGDGRYIKGIAEPVVGSGPGRTTKILCCGYIYIPAPG